VRDHDVADWSRTFLADLAGVRDARSAQATEGAGA